jgi:hypothetical protein
MGLSVVIVLSFLSLNTLVSTAEEPTGPPEEWADDEMGVYEKVPGSSASSASGGASSSGGQEVGLPECSEFMSGEVNADAPNMPLSYFKYLAESNGEEFKESDWVQVSCAVDGRPESMWVLRAESAEKQARETWAAVKIYPAPVELSHLWADSRQLVNLPIWVWLADRSEEKFGPKTAVSKSGDITLVARMEKVEIAWGDGSTKTCGRDELDAVFDKETALFAGGTRMHASPKCGWKYWDSGEFKVTTTATWVGEWSGLGKSGVLTKQISWEPEPFKVWELQAVNVPNNP